MFIVSIVKVVILCLGMIDICFKEFIVNFRCFILVVGYSINLVMLIVYLRLIRSDRI